MKLFSTLFKNFLKTSFKTVLNFYKTFSKLFWTFFSFVWLSPCCVISLFVIIMNYLFRCADSAPSCGVPSCWPTCSLCSAALRIVWIGYTATPLCCYQQRRLALCAFILCYYCGMGQTSARNAGECTKLNDVIMYVNFFTKFKFFYYIYILFFSYFVYFIILL